jgi:YVTN family beta-propeller protein
MSFPRIAFRNVTVLAGLAALLGGCVPAPGAGVSGSPVYAGGGYGGSAPDTLGMFLRPLRPDEVAAVGPVLAVTAEGNRAVAFMSAATGRIFAAVAVGWAPRAVVASADGRTVWVVNSAGDRFGLGSLSIVSTEDLREVDRIDLSPYGSLRGMALTRSENYLYVACEGRRAVLEINLISRNVDRAFVLPRGVPSQLAFNDTETRLFATDPATSTLWAIDLTTGGFQEVRVGSGPEGIALSPDGLTLWVTNRDDGTVSLVDPNTLVPQGSLIAGRIPVAVAFTRDGEKALVVVEGESAVAVFGATSRARLQSIPVAAYPTAILVDPGGTRAWVTSARDNVVSLIDLPEMRTRGSVPAGRMPAGLAWVRPR